MIHLYCGDGKGKTSCAFGQVLRYVGRGGRAAVAQFLKGADSGERLALSGVPGVLLAPVPEQMKFTFAMDEAERRRAAADCAQLLAWAQERAAEGCGLVVLDECCPAISTGMLSLEAVCAFLDRNPETEILLTGREAAPELLDRADYITEMRKIRHPYDRGVQARLGIEW